MPWFYAKNIADSELGEILTIKKNYCTFDIWFFLISISIFTSMFSSSSLVWPMRQKVPALTFVLPLRAALKKILKVWWHALPLLLGEICFWYDFKTLMMKFSQVCVQFRDDDFISEAGASGVFPDSLYSWMVRLEVPRIPFHQESSRLAVGWHNLPMAYPHYASQKVFRTGGM